MPALSSFRKPVVLAAAAVGFAGLGVSLAQVPGAADSARAELESAKVALEAGDTDAATDAVDRAREHTDTVQVGVQGPAGLVGQWLPVVGTSVRDARHLGDALDAVVSVAELGAEAYPEITGDEATFFEAGHVDIPTLERLVATAGDAEDDLTRASTSLSAIEATGPAGARLGDARDQALAQVDPLLDDLSGLMPLMRQLPAILGAEGERKYLLAILNPAEMLYSGGTALSYAPVTVSDGRVTIGETVDTDANRAMFQPRYWRKVQGNPFHRGPIRVALGGMAPSWPVAGEETLNAWRSLRGRNMSGLVAVDVIALARLSEITGPMDVPGYGRVDSTNLVETLVGSYDDYADSDDDRGAQGGQPRPRAALRRAPAGHRPAPRQGPGPGRRRRRSALRGLLPRRRGAGHARRPRDQRRPLRHQARLPRRLHAERRAQQDRLLAVAHGPLRRAPAPGRQRAGGARGGGPQRQRAVRRSRHRPAAGLLHPLGQPVRRLVPAPPGRRRAGDASTGSRSTSPWATTSAARSCGTRSSCRRRSGAPCAWSTTSRPPPSATATP